MASQFAAWLAAELSSHCGILTPAIHRTSMSDASTFCDFPSRGPSRSLRPRSPRGTARWCTSGARGSSRPRRKKNAVTGRASRKIRGSNTAVKTLAPSELPTPSDCALSCKRCSLDLSRTAEGRGTEHGYSSLSFFPLVVVRKKFSGKLFGKQHLSLSFFALRPFCALG